MSHQEDSEAKLRALREAAQVGLADLKAGRHETFTDGDALHRHVKGLVERGMARRAKK